jgi:hypothetical protein
MRATVAKRLRRAAVREAYKEYGRNWYKHTKRIGRAMKKAWSEMPWTARFAARARVG